MAKSTRKPVKRRKKRAAAPEMRPGEIIIHVFLAAMLGIFALFTFDEKYTKMDESKYMFLFYAVCFTAFAFACLALHTIVTRRNELLKRDGLLMNALRGASVADWAVVGLMLVMLVSSLASPYSRLAFSGEASRFEGFWTLLMYGFIYFAVSRFYTHRTYVFLLFAACASLVSVIGLLQFYGYDIMGLSASAPPVSFPFGGIFMTTIGNVNVVSAFACFVIPLFTALYLKTEDRLRYIYLATALLAWYLELIAHSDSGFVGLFGAFLLLLPFILSDLRSLAKLLVFVSGAGFVAFLYGTIAREQVAPNIDGVSGALFKANPAMLAIAVLALVLAVVVHLISKRYTLPAKLIKRAAAVIVIICICGALLVGWFYPAREDGNTFLYEYTQAMRGQMADEFGSNRGYVWRISLEIYGETTPVQKLIGIGPGVFRQVFDERNMEESVQRYGYSFDRAHNEYLQTLVTLGALGLLAYLVILAAHMARAWKYSANPVVLALGAALLCFYIQAFFNFSVTIITPFFWIFLGMLANQAPKIGIRK